jgi:hypothetical protein
LQFLSRIKRKELDRATFLMQARKARNSGEDKNDVAGCKTRLDQPIETGYKREVGSFLASRHGCLCVWSWGKEWRLLAGASGAKVPQWTFIPTLTAELTGGSR